MFRYFFFDFSSRYAEKISACANQVLDALESAFVADGVRFIRIDGKTQPARRHQLVESFQVCLRLPHFSECDFIACMCQS